MNTTRFFTVLFVLFQIRQKLQKEKDIYGLGEPNVFSFTKFKGFCDVITSGIAPFEGIDIKSHGGKLYKEVVKALYKIECEKLINDENTRVIDMKSNEFDTEKFNEVILQKLDCYKADADAELKQSFIAIGDKETFF